DEVVAVGATQPLIAVDRFYFRSGILGLFFKPTHVRAVQVTGLRINIPPRQMRQQSSERKSRHRGKIRIVVANIVCENSSLILQNSNPNKDPKNFQLKHIELHDVGPNAPWSYDAILTNAVPRGE